MKMICLPVVGCAAAILLVSIHGAQAQTGVDLLENGGFEYMATGLVTGNNIGSVPTGWTISSGEANWQQGPATGSGTSVSLPPYAGAYGGGTTTEAYNTNTDTGGTTSHFFDGTNDVNNFTILYQNFTLSKTTTLTGSFALGARDAANGNVSAGAGESGTLTSAAANPTTSTLQIINLSTGVAVPITYGGTSSTTYYGDTSKITVGNWEVNPFTVNNLPAGTYKFVVSLYGSQNLDGVALVPEPSSVVVAMAGFGLLMWGQRLRRRS